MQYLKIILFFAFFVSVVEGNNNCIENGVNTYGTAPTNVAFGTNSDITTPSNFIPTTSITLNDSTNNQTCIVVNAIPTDCNASGTLFSFTSFMKNQTVVTPTIDQVFSNLSAETSPTYNNGSTQDITTNQNYNNLSVTLHTHVSLQTQNNPLKINNLHIDDINSSLYVTSQNPYDLEIKTVNMGNAANTFLTLQNAQYFKTQSFTQAQDASIRLPNIERIDAGNWNFAGDGACSQIEGTHGDYRFNKLGDNKNKSAIIINGADRVYAGNIASNNVYLKTDTLSVLTDLTLGENGNMSVQTNPANQTNEVNVTINGKFDIKKNSQVCLAAGDYYFNDLSIGDDVHIDPIGSGTVRIFVNNNFTDNTTAGHGFYINKGGDPSKMLVYTKNDLTINDNVAISGLVISDGNIKIGASNAASSTVKGATISKNLNMVANAHITYDRYVNNLDSNSSNLTCNTPTSKTLTYSNSGRCQFVFTTPASCPSPTSTGGGSYSAPYGSFNIIDGATTLSSNADSTDFASTDNVLHTQIMKKDFNVSLVHLNYDDLTTLDPAFDGYVMVDVADAKYITKENAFSCINAEQIVDLGLFYSFNGTITPHPYSMNNVLINKIAKNATFRIKYIDSASLPCSPAPTNKAELEQCLTANGLSDSNLSVVCARNNFAIRPQNFTITKSDNNFTLKAGQDFNLTFQALDYLGAQATDYNESLQNQSISPSLMYNDENNLTCATGSVTLPSSSFINGEINTSLSYNDVGDVNLTIEDTNGSEFALVDASDTSDALRLITPASVILHVLPHHFGINAGYYNFNNGTFTYLSNDLNMSSILDINITAQTEQNTTTTNYNRLCYAQTTNTNIAYLINGNTSSRKLIYKEENTSEINATTLSLSNLNANYFNTDNNGTATLSIKINSERNISNSINPFVLTITDINITDANSTQGTITLDKNATFIYGRTHGTRQRFKGKEGNATLYYEAYCNASDSFGVSCDKTLLPNGNASLYSDDPRWFKNTLHSPTTDGNISQVTQKNGLGVVTASTLTQTNPDQTTLSYTQTNFPYNTTMDINSSSWLIYNKYNPNAQVNEFEVEFLQDGAWTGAHETNTTTTKNAVTTTNRRTMW